MAESSPNKSADTKPRPKKLTANQPKIYDIVIAAVTTLNDRKGATIPGILKYVKENYPEIDPNTVRYRLKKALEKGLNEGLLVRPTGSESKGFTGRFKLDKVKVAALKKPKVQNTKEKEKAEKTKAVKKKAKDEDKPKKKKVVETKSPKKTKKTDTLKTKAKSDKKTEKSTKAKVTKDAKKEKTKVAKKTPTKKSPKKKAAKSKKE
ncbi:hypothetical protein ScPMuIL_003757 [Solemya velum]